MRGKFITPTGEIRVKWLNVYIHSIQTIFPHPFCRRTDISRESDTDTYVYINRVILKNNRFDNCSTNKTDFQSLA